MIAAGSKKKVKVEKLIFPDTDKTLLVKRSLWMRKNNWLLGNWTIAYKLKEEKCFVG